MMILTEHYQKQGFRLAIVTTENGYTWSTAINGTDESICEYFLGKYFNTKPFPFEEMSMVTSVSIDGKTYQG